MPTSPFQALVFDLGGVVVEHDNQVLFTRLASRCRAGWAPDDAAALFRQSRWGTGTPIRLFHQQLADTAGYDASWDVFVEDWSCHLVINPSMLGVVERLARRNRVMIFSNTNQEHWEFVLRASGGLLADFEPYLSHEIGHEKPSLRSFEVVAEMAGIDPTRSVFFDDLPANVAGARQAGFQAEVFQGEAWLLSFLAERALHWTERGYRRICARNRRPAAVSPIRAAPSTQLRETKPRALASSQIGRRGQDVRQASMTSA